VEHENIGERSRQAILAWMAYGGVSLLQVLPGCDAGSATAVKGWSSLTLVIKMMGRR